MTLFAETSPRIAYLGTGVTVDFAYPFRVLEDLELAVYVDGDLKGLGSHYSVTGIDTPTGGTVTFFLAPPLNALVLLMRDMPLTQPVDLREHDALSAETQEREYDRLTMLIQWQEDQHAHMLRLADLSPTILPQGSLPEPELGKFLRWHDPTHLDNAEVVSAGTLTIGGDVPGHAAFWVAPQALGGDPGFFWDPARRGLTLARGMHEGGAPLTPHKDGPLHVFLKNSDNVNGYNGILCHVHNGAPTDTLSTLGNDKVAVGGWTKRGFGGSSPIYGGNFGVVFDSPGVANGCEIDVQNDSGTDNHGQGLWVNGSGGNHRSNAILIDTQDTSKWRNGIMFTHNAGGGATGNVTFAGILFDHNQSQNHILIVPYDDLNPSNNVLEVRDSVFDQVRAGIQKRGAFAGRASATGFNDPTFTWTDSPRSGIYSPAIEHFAITTNGFPRAHITDTGDTYLFALAGSGTAGVSVEADGRLIRGAGGGGGGGAITSPLVVSGAAVGRLRLLELPANGTEYVGFKAPDALAGNRMWTLPAIDGTNGQVLTTNGTLGLSWTTPAGGGGGAVTSVGGLAGVIGVTNDVNVTMTSTSPNLVLGWTGTLGTSRGGTGTGGAPAGQAAVWTASGLSGDTGFLWDTAAKKLTVSGPAGGAVSDAKVRLENTATGVAAARTPLALVRALATGQMIDGFAVRQDFILRDQDGADNLVVRFVAERSGSDALAIFRLQTSDGLLPVDRLTINALGQMFYTPSPTVGTFAFAANGTRRTEVQFQTNNGAQVVAFVAPPTATGNHIWMLPSTFGAAGQVLSLLDGAGTLGWAAGTSGVTTTGTPGPNQFAFMTSTTTISSSPSFAFNAGTGVVSLNQPGSMEIGVPPFGAQAAGPLKVTISNSDNLSPYQAMLGQVVNGTPGVLPHTVGNDKVAVSGWAHRGPGGTSPIYGGNFTANFSTAGPAYGIELGVINNSGTHFVGNGLWVNSDGLYHKDNAILIDTQNASKWGAGIRFTEGNTGGGATGSTLNYGIIFDKSADLDFLVIRPRVGGNNVAIRITNPAFSANVFSLTNLGEINTNGNINTIANIGAVQYFANALPGQTVNVVIPTVGTLHFTGGILTAFT